MTRKEILNGKIFLDLKKAQIYYFSSFIEKEKAWELFNFLMQNIPWKQEKIRIFGKWVSEPRLTCWMGDEGAIYQYSGKSRKPLEWSPEVSDIKKELENFTGVPFNSVLINLYRDGNDSNGWHKDNEKELGEDPQIASLSLGESRIMELRSDDKQEKVKIVLENGSLLFMGSGSQVHYFHQIPKCKLVDKPRINLTFRHIKYKGIQ